MKRLLTFIYGLLHLAFSLCLFYKFEITKEWFSWIYFGLGVLLVLQCLTKLDKATE